MIDRPVSIPPEGLEGDLQIPATARGLVLFAHGSGSSRHSSRNRHVARLLQQGGFATLLMDLLTSEEEQVDMHTAQLRFNIPLLGERLVHAIDWLAEDADAGHLKMGVFGASTGAAAALMAAAERPTRANAIVSRGGRPDLAREALPQVTAPTLLIVGGDDGPVIEFNQWALAKLSAPKKLRIIPGATHLFEEPGALDEVARLAVDWFRRHLSPADRAWWSA
jgi:dienelactone hydrolase